MTPRAIAAVAGAVAASSLQLQLASARLLGNRFLTEEPPPSSQVEDEEPPLGLEGSPSMQGSLIAQQFTADPHARRDHFEMILNGELGLTGIRYSPHSFVAGGDDGYADVYGEFCAFDPRLNRVDPSYYPTHKDVLAESEHCGEHIYTIPLGDVMQAVEKGGSSKTLPLSGMLFHQGYAGAGLVSNALTAFDSTLVVSEHEALHDALAACDVIRNRYRSDNCSPEKQGRLVRDIVKLISRTPEESVEHLFLKLHSASAAYLPMLRALYPDAKWTFSYRDAGETLSKTMQRKRSASCVKASRNPSAALAAKSAEHNVELGGLSRHEVCAMHLSTLLEAAVRENEASGTGMLVSYADVVSSLGNVIIEGVLPYLGLQSELTPQVKDRVANILSTRSNSRNNGARGEQKTWDRSQEENLEISEEVSDAVKKFALILS